MGFWNDDAEKEEDRSCRLKQLWVCIGDVYLKYKKKQTWIRISQLVFPNTTQVQFKVILHVCVKQVFDVLEDKSFIQYKSNFRWKAYETT